MRLRQTGGRRGAAAGSTEEICKVLALETRGEGIVPYMGTFYNSVCLDGSVNFQKLLVRSSVEDMAGVVNGNGTESSTRRIRSLTYRVDNPFTAGSDFDVWMSNASGTMTIGRLAFGECIRRGSLSPQIQNGSVGIEPPFPVTMIVGIESVMGSVIRGDDVDGVLALMDAHGVMATSLPTDFAKLLRQQEG